MVAVRAARAARRRGGASVCACLAPSGRERKQPSGLAKTSSHLEQRMWTSHYFLRKRYKSLECSDSIWLPLPAACHMRGASRQLWK